MQFVAIPIPILIHSIPCLFFNFPVLEMTMYDGRMVFGFLVLLGFNVVFVIVAALLIAFEVSCFLFFQ